MTQPRAPLPGATVGRGPVRRVRARALSLRRGCGGVGARGPRRQLRRSDDAEAIERSARAAAAGAAAARWRRRRRNLPETTPAVGAPARWAAAVDELVDACDGFLRRAAIELSLTPDERREILRGMALTRATDNRLKAFFTGGEVRYGDAAFQGKGFRSLGQEAIYAAGIRLRRGDAYRDRRTAGAATSSRRSSAISASRSRCDPAPATRCGWCCRRRWPRPGRR